jgi:hypothetical protein
MIKYGSFLPAVALGFGFDVRRSIPEQIRGNNFDETLRRIERSTAEINRAVQAAPSSNDSFGERLKEAVRKKLGPKRQTQRKEQVERERYRYKPRPRTKGE